ncbi:transglutaminase family protein [Cellulophaga sp. E16_2]|uniref:transglutaminase domain-containing protein n=1 Tax=unclassified Cellulophaga TaxID=2634405 RepID=UPI0013FE3962|nr:MULTISPECIES: transglutaminase family protein [unclassified Cellulophaga]MBO0593572.1 transglutaminase family protein [Cellulophaga sp. E16_2]
MVLRISFDLLFDLEVPTPFILMLRPRSNAAQWVEREAYKISPMIPVVEHTDIAGNLCQRLIAPSGTFSISTKAEVQVPEFVAVNFGAPFVEIQNLPDAILRYLLPSRYCESDRFNDLAVSITANELPGYNQVAAIESWLRNTISYIPGSSNFPISAVDVNYRQSGVCRDLAHLGIALCRSISIPARIVVGYLHNLKPMDMHAWFEVYVGGRWYTFDATQTGQKGGYVAIGYGTDAADVAVFNQFGPGVVPLKQVVTVELVAEKSENLQPNI